MWEGKYFYPTLALPQQFGVVSRLRPGGNKSPDLRNHQRKSGDLPPLGRSRENTPNRGVAILVHPRF